MGHELYIDLFIIQNILYDYLILTGVALLTNEKMKPGRLLMGLMISLCLSMIFFLIDAPLLLSFVPIAVIWGVFNQKGWKEFFKKIIYFYCLSMLLSGGIYTIAHFVKFDMDIVSYMIVLFCISFTMTIIYVMKHKFIEHELVLKQFKHEVTIIVGNKTINGVGFVDTGNHLSDNKTAEPIIMIPSEFVTSVDVKRYLDEQQIESWYTEYSVINSSSEKLLVFKPTVILIDQKVASKGIIGIVEDKFFDYDFLLQPSVVMGI